MRLRPASLSACAFFGSSDPFVVSVRSTGSAASISIRRLDADAQQRLAAREPDLRDAHVYRCRSATRVISSNVSSSLRSRKR